MNTHVQHQSLSGSKTARTGRRWSVPGAIAAIFVALAGAAVADRPALAQAGISNFLPIGCYYNKADNNRLWVAAIAQNKKFTEQDFYSDDAFHVILQNGDLRQEIKGSDVLVHPMAAFDFKGAEKYQFMKYSLVVDYSGSIGTWQVEVLNVLDEFLERLPLAIEGQLIRFSDRVEKFPFTRNKTDIRSQLKQPILNGQTALNDALMEGATALVKEGADIPLKVLILFTDGFDNASVTYNDKQNFLATFTGQVKTAKIAVLAVGVGDQQDEAVMKAITNVGAGVAGVYIKRANFRDFRAAFKQVETIMRNTVVFRIPKFGPDQGKATISLTTKSKGGTHTTIQQFDCEY